MSINNRILANMWRMANTDGNQNPTGLKNVITSAGAPPTTAISAYPAFYVNTTTNEVYYTAVGPTPVWTLINGTSGAVVGPASATANNIATFDGVSGKIIKDSGKALPAGLLLGSTDTQTLSNKTLDAANLTGTTQINGSVGTTGYVLTSNGSSGPATWNALATPTGGQLRAIVFNSGSTNWTVPTGVTNIIIRGSGGGGGCAVSDGQSGGGGGYFEHQLTVTSGSVVTVDVGSGGAGGQPLNSTGQAGGTTTITYGGTAVASGTGGAGGGSGASGGGGGASGNLQAFSGGNGSTVATYVPGQSGWGAPISRRQSNGPGAGGFGDGNIGGSSGTAGRVIISYNG